MHLDILSPSHFDAIPENVVPEVNMQTDENNPDGDQSQQQVAPDLQPQEVVDVRNAVRWFCPLQVLKRLHWFLIGQVSP